MAESDWMAPEDGSSASPACHSPLSWVSGASVEVVEGRRAVQDSVAHVRIPHSAVHELGFDDPEQSPKFETGRMSRA
jgi:hypothetical protein